MSRNACRCLSALVLIGVYIGWVASPARGQGVGGGFQAAGGPIANCFGERQAMEQLQSGLPRINEWIAKTESQLAAAQRSADAARQELADRAKEMALSQARSLAERQLQSVKMLRARVEALRDAGLSRTERRQWLEGMKKLEDLAEKTEDLVDKAASAKPGAVDHLMNLKNQMQQNAVGFNEFATFLDQSGIGSTAATELSKLIHPIFGPMVVEGLQVATDVGVIAAGGLMSAAEADQARRNLNDMRNARSVVESKIASHAEVLGGPLCKQPTQVATQDSTQLVRADPAPPQAPQIPTPPAENAGGNSGNAGASSGGGGMGAGTVAGITAAAVGGGVGLYALNEYQKSIKCDQYETEMDGRMTTLTNAVNSLLQCGQSLSCFDARERTVNNAVSGILTTAGNWCSCLGPDAATQLSPSDKAAVRDALNSLRGYGISTGNMPACFR